MSALHQAPMVTGKPMFFACLSRWLSMLYLQQTIVVIETPDGPPKNYQHNCHAQRDPTAEATESSKGGPDVPRYDLDALEKEKRKVKNEKKKAKNKRAKQRKSEKRQRARAEASGARTDPIPPIQPLRQFLYAFELPAPITPRDPIPDPGVWSFVPMITVTDHDDAYSEGNHAHEHDLEYEGIHKVNSVAVRGLRAETQAESFETASTMNAKAALQHSLNLLPSEILNAKIREPIKSAATEYTCLDWSGDCPYPELYRHFNGRIEFCTALAWVPGC